MALAGLLVQGAQAAQAEDGTALLKKIQAAYTGLKSYSQKASSTVTLKLGTQRQVEGQLTELRYQQPNKVFMSISSPRVGTVVSFNNGREMLVYHSNINSYQKRPGHQTVKSYVMALREFNIATMLDPLAFLTGDPVQAVVSAAVLKGGEMLNGIACNVIVGQLKSSLIGSAKSGTVTFWADKSTNLLRKIQIENRGIPATVPVKAVVNKKPVVNVRKFAVDQTFSITIQEMHVNPPMTDASFNYALPKGAIEQNPDKMLKK